MSHLAWLPLPDFAGRWFCSQKTSDRCLASLSTISSPLMWKKQHGAWLFRAQSWLLRENWLVLCSRYMGLFSSQSISHASFHLVLPTAQLGHWGLLVLVHLWAEKPQFEPRLPDSTSLLIPEYSLGQHKKKGDRQTRKTIHSAQVPGTDRCVLFWWSYG